MTDEELFEKLITSEVYEDTLLAMTIMPEKWKNLTYENVYDWKIGKKARLYSILLHYYVDSNNIYLEKSGSKYRLKKFNSNEILL